MRLGISESDDRAAVDDLGDDRVGHGTTGGLEKSTADDDGLEIRLDNERLADLLHDDHVFDRAAAEAAVFLRERCAEDTEFLGEGFPDVRVPAALAVHRRHPRVEGVGIGQIARDRVA